MSNWTSIGKYLSGNTTAEEKEQLEKKLILDSKFRTDFEKAKIIWEATAESRLIFPDTEKEWWRLKSRIESQKIPENKKDYKKLRRLAWRLPLAASVLIISFYMGILSSESDYQTMEIKAMIPEKVLTKLNQEIEDRENKFFEVFTTSEEKSIYLPDSSLVTLSPGTYLKYDSTAFGIDHRKVYLTGEAFFDVVRDTTRFFEIFAEGTQTKVLGTSFNLRAYEVEDSITLLVTSGLVSFNVDQGFQKSLRKDDYLAYYKEKNEYAVNSVEQKVEKKKNVKPLVVKNSKKARLNIKDSLYLTYEFDKRLINRYAFRGVIENVSDDYSAGNIQLEFTFYSKKEGKVSSKYIRINDDIKPNSSLLIKNTLGESWLISTDSISVKITEASETSVYEKRDE